MEIQSKYSDRKVSLTLTSPSNYRLEVRDYTGTHFAYILREEMERVAREILGIKEPEQTLADKIRALPVGTKFVFTDETEYVNVKVTDKDWFYYSPEESIDDAKNYDNTPSVAGYDIEVIE